MTGVRLGIRWFWRAAPAARGVRLRRILASALVVWAVLMAVCMWSGNRDRAERGLAQLPAPGGAAMGNFRAYHTDNPFRGDIWTTVFVGDTDASTDLPPGLAHLPVPGQAYISSAVAEAVRRDPAVAGRIPGKVVGIVGDAGLQSPDQFYVVAGARPTDAWPTAHGWGGDALGVQRPAIPAGPLVGLLAALVGLPALMLAWIGGRMAATARQRSFASLHLLGVDRRTLATAAAVDAACAAAAGSIIGVSLAAALVSLTHDTTVLGFAWFAPPTLVAPGWALVTCAVTTCFMAWDAGRMASATGTDSLAASAGAPRRLRKWPLLGLLAVAAMGGLAISHALGRTTSSGIGVLCFYVGGGVAVLSLAAGMPALLEWLARRLLRRHGALLVARRLSWRRDNIASAVVGIGLVAVTSMVGVGIVADLSAMSPANPTGDVYDIQGVPDAQLGAVLGVPSALSYLEIDRGKKSTKVLTCASLTTLLHRAETLAPTADVPCETGSGTPLVASAHGQATRNHLVVPALKGTVLQGSTVIIADPQSFVGTDVYAGIAGQRDVMTMPGPRQSDVDTYLDAVLSSVPSAQVSELAVDSFHSMVSPTRRFLLLCTAVGLLIALALMLFTARDAQQGTRADAARLMVLGVGRARVARVHADAYGAGLGLAAVTGISVGLLTATVYDIAGGLVGGPGGLGVVVVLLTGLVVAAARLFVLLRDATGKDVIADLRTE
jgi:hypothetical protein